MSQGALMLYGGSNISAASLEDFQVTDNETTTAASLRTPSWDTAVWLFDLSSRQWQQLSTQGTKLPGLMYHSMQASGKQVRVDIWPGSPSGSVAGSLYIQHVGDHLISCQQGFRGKKTSPLTAIMWLAPVAWLPAAPAFLRVSAGCRVWWAGV
jgi:hypothetical protein